MSTTTTTNSVNVDVDTITIEPSQQHMHTIIFLHGRDSIAADFASELFESQASDAAQSTLTQLLPGVKWVFPGAGMRHSARFGCELSQWFDIWSVEEPREREELQVEGLEESVEEVLEVLEREARLLPPPGRERVVLAGISQGCATAVAALLRGGRRCGALVGFSGWMPLGAEAVVVAAAAAGERGGAEGEDQGRSGYGGALETPVFLEHCGDDDVVPVRNGESLRDCLTGLGMDVEWHGYEDGGHWVNEPQGIDDLVDFLKRVL